MVYFSPKKRKKKRRRKKLDALLVILKATKDIIKNKMATEGNSVHLISVWHD